MRDRLTVVLRVRRAQERLAQAEAARAEGEVRAARETREARAEAHAGRDAVAGGLSSLQLRALQLQGLASYAGVLEASVAEEQARTRRDGAAAEHSAAAVRRKGAERMSERRNDVAAALAATNAQRMLDELSVTRWRKQ